MSEEKKSTVFGIDLGTTYSCISYLDETGRPVVCPSMEGDNTVPSVVRMLPEEESPVAGKTAKDMAMFYPDNTIQFVKSKIGHVEKLEYGPPENRLTTTPVDVSAEILKKLAHDAQAMTNTEVRDVVITVPAYFGNNEKAATKQAGIQAGLNVVDIVEEPTAAAFFYGCQNSENNEVICIFDLGGGTFDVTAMRLGDGSLTVLTTDGDHDLGGRRWDEELIGLVEEKFREQTGYAEAFDAEVLQDIQIKCEAAKKTLSNTTSTQIALAVDRRTRAAVTVTRDEFNARTSYLLATAIDLTRKVFDRMKEKGISIDKILLVGGSTWMPQVREAIQQEFGMDPLINEPDQSVSKGACIYCAWRFLHQTTTESSNGSDVSTSEGSPDPGQDQLLSKTEMEDGRTEILLQDDKGETRKLDIFLPTKIKNTVLVTVATKSFGIRTLHNKKVVITNLILKDTPLPYSVTRTFGTSEPDMRNVSIELFQSELYDEMYELEEGINIGDSVLTGLPSGLPEGAPIDITITLDANGLIEITGTHGGAPLHGELKMTFSEGTAERET